MTGVWNACPMVSWLPCSTASPKPGRQQHQDTQISKPSWRMLQLAALLLALSWPLKPPAVSALQVLDLETTRLLLLEAHRQPMQRFLREHRRALHQIPELKFEEELTSAYLRAQLDQMNITYQYPVAKTGIVAQIGSGAQPIVALRADMDALPINEPHSLEAGQGGWVSGHAGLMHACGHDAHMTMLLGAARILKAQEPLLSGTVLLVFQPAEEGGGGAVKVLESGLLAGVKAMAGVHVWPTLPSGTISTRANAMMASSDRFVILVKGKGAHGAMPHLGADPIVAASAIVLALQPLVSRETSPLDSAVVTVGIFNSSLGACNIIADSVQLEGTMRALSRSTMERLRRRIAEVAHATAAAYGCTVAPVTFSAVPYGAVVNDPDMADMLSQVAMRLAEAAEDLKTNPATLDEAPDTLDEEDLSTSSNNNNGTCSSSASGGGACKAALDSSSSSSSSSGTGIPVPQPVVGWQPLSEPSMAAEDFSFYAEQIPSVFSFLGTGSAALGTDVGLHNPNFQMDESVMALGATLHAMVALSCLATPETQAPTELK